MTEPRSHTADAAHLLGLRASARELIDVTVPSRCGRSRPGIDVHRTRSLPPGEVTSVRGIPSTTVARTLLDLAEVVPPRSLERALDQAEVLRVFDLRALETSIARARHRRGAKLLRAALTDHSPGTTVTRSELEERFLALCSAASVPQPRVNAWITLPDGGSAIQADFSWPEHRLIVETDGRGSHATHRAFEADRDRDRRLVLAGWVVIRFTWRQLTQEREEVIATLRQLIAATVSRS